MWKPGNLLAEVPTCHDCGAFINPRWRECLACGALLGGDNDPRTTAGPDKSRPDAVHPTPPGTECRDRQPATTEASRSPSWDSETAALVEWFERTPAPAQPFRLAPGVFVARPAHFWEALRRDIAAGPNGPRARYGALQSDLRRLHDQQEITPPTSPGQGETTPLTAG